MSAQIGRRAWAATRMQGGPCRWQMDPPPPSANYLLLHCCRRQLLHRHHRHQPRQCWISKPRPPPRGSAHGWIRRLVIYMCEHARPNTPKPASFDMSLRRGQPGAGRGMSSRLCCTRVRSQYCTCRNYIGIAISNRSSSTDLLRAGSESVCRRFTISLACMPIRTPIPIIRNATTL